MGSDRYHGRPPRLSECQWACSSISRASVLQAEGRGCNSCQVHVVYTGEKKREYQRQWMANRRAKGVELLGGCCAKCSVASHLEFDHVDPETKWSHRFWSYSWAKIKTELDKCQLLCNTCHKEKTSAMFEGPKHGTHYMYVAFKCRCQPCRDDHARVNAKYRG